MSNIPTVVAIYQAFGQGDIPAILSHLDPNVQWQAHQDNFAQKKGVPWARAGTGPQAAIDFFTALNDAMEFTAFTPGDLMEGGNKVAATITATVIIRATGQSVDEEEMHLFEFNDAGKVTAWKNFGDTAKQIEMAGLG